jgi:hypothetical protein
MVKKFRDEFLDAIQQGVSARARDSATRSVGGLAA